MERFSLVKSATTTSTIIDFPNVLAIRRGKYLVRLAQNQAEVDIALRLRFAIFNVELGEGLAKSFASGKDEEPFDLRCEHLLLIDQQANQIIGTCRLRVHDKHKTVADCFSSTRFNLTTLPANVFHHSVEFGRVCISKSHRNKDSFGLLWNFLSHYAQQKQMRYLLGCCAMSSQDPLAGGQVFEWLLQSGYVHTEYKVVPKPGSKCIFYKPLLGKSARALPSTLHSYLRFGARVCGLPALDRDFRTINFFTLLSLEEITRTRTHLLSRAS